MNVVIWEQFVQGLPGETMGPLTSAGGSHANQEPPGSMDGGNHGLLATGGGQLAVLALRRTLPSSTPMALTVEQWPYMQVSNPLSLFHCSPHRESYDMPRQAR